MPNSSTSPHHAPEGGNLPPGSVPIAGSVSSALRTISARLTGSTYALNVAIVDSNGNQVSSFGGSGGTAMTDDAAFTPGTTSVTPAAGTYRSTRDNLDDGDGGAIALTQKRAVYTAIETPNGDSAMDDTNDSVKVTISADDVGIGGGIQYTENDTDASITGTAILMEGAANTLLPVQGTVADGILVNLGSNNDVTVTGVSTAANQTTIIGHLDGVEGLLTTIDGDTGNIATDVDTLASTVATVSATPLTRVAIFDSNDTQITTFGGGTQYTEDAAAAANPVGTALIGVRADTLAGVTSTDGDNVAARMTDKGEQYVKHVDAIPVTDNGGALTVDASNLDIRDLAAASDSVAVHGDVGVLDQLDLTNSNPAAVAIVDSNGDQITSFGGGTQYTEGDTDASITGTAMLMEGAGNALVPAQGTTTDGLLVNLGSNNDVTVTGVSTAANQTTIIGHLDGVETLLTTIAGDTTDIEAAVELLDDTVATVSATKLLRVGIFDNADAQITTFGGGTQYTEDAAAAADPVGTALIGVRADTLAAVTSTDGDNIAARMTNNGELYVRHVDSINVNPDVTYDAGPSNSATQRVISASDDPGVTKLGTIDTTLTSIDGVLNGISVSVDNIDTDTTSIKNAVEILDDVVWAEDDATASGHTGVPIFARRTDTPANQSGTDGDYEWLQVSGGRLWVDASGKTLTVSDATAQASLSVMDDWDNGASDGASVSGDVAHDTADAGEPVKMGGRAIAHGANPTAVAAADRTNWYFNRAGIPFFIGGHPNIVTKNLNVTDADGAQTNVALVTVATGLKIVVTHLTVTCDHANTSATQVRIGFGTASTPAADANGIILAHAGIPPGSGVSIGNGGGIIGVGADDEDLRLTCEDPVAGSIDIVVGYYTIES